MQYIYYEISKMVNYNIFVMAVNLLQVLVKSILPYSPVGGNCFTDFIVMDVTLLCKYCISIIQ